MGIAKFDIINNSIARYFMDNGSLAEARNIIMLSMIILSAFLDPRASQALARPLMGIWRKCKVYFTLVQPTSLKKQAGGFWEIDLSKLEP